MASLSVSSPPHSTKVDFELADGGNSLHASFEVYCEGRVYAAEVTLTRSAETRNVAKSDYQPQEE